MSRTEHGPPDAPAVSPAAGSVTVQCPACGVRGRFVPRQDLAGPVRIRCKQCREIFPFDPATENLGLPPRRPTSEGTGAPRLTAGEVLAGRFRIVAPLGQGGMGEVYEAEDRELGGLVALKTVRPELARQPDSLQRFKREIQLARRVTHPNVCRVFDVFRHRPASSDRAGDEILFLTMELLRGETLAGRLARTGPLGTDEAEPIARQLAAALDAAHRAGVVHRDFKSGNVILSPSEDGGTRAVVTDFGLARPSPDSGVTAALTVGRDALGTPDYMAPEQVEGGEITSAVDLYAFGITLYEVVTGRRPFAGGSPLTTAVKRLTEPPPTPRSLVPDLDPRWERMILGCLARQPNDRFGSAGEALATLDRDRALEAGPDGSGEDAGARPTPAKGRAYRLKVGVLLLVIAASAAVAVYRFLSWKPPDSPVLQVLGIEPGDLVMRRSVAVTALRDLTESPDSAWLSPALAEMLRTELRVGEQLRVVGDDQMAGLDPELAVSRGEGATPEVLERLRRALGADYVVTGSYATLGEPPERRIRLDLHLHDAVRAQPVGSIREAGAETDLFDLVARAGTELRGKLEVSDPEVGEGARRAALPATPEAARLYAEGLARLNRYDPLGARDLLQRAADIEPTNALIHSALASAWSSLGYARRAGEEARRALEAGASLPREERLSIEAQLLESQGDWLRAAQAYRNLWALYPDDAEYGVRLVTAQTRAGLPREAMTSVAALRTLPEPAAQDPRIDLAEARAAQALGELERSRAAAERAAELAAAQGLAALVAPARLAECEALRKLGRLDDARAACEEAGQITAERGDRPGQAAAIAGLGGVLLEAGDLAGARENLERAAAIHRETGSRGATAFVLNNLAVVLRSQGEVARARGLYEEVLALSRETGDAIGEAYSLSNLGSLLMQQGELARAGELAHEALEIHRTTGDRGGEATALALLGVVASLSGDVATARSNLESALELQREIGHRRGEAGTLKELGRLALDAGDLDEAHRRFAAVLAMSRSDGHRDLVAAGLAGTGVVLFQRGELEAAAGRLRESLEIRTELGQRGASAESRSALARVALEQGNAAEAATLAGLAAREAERQGLVDDRAWALAIRARALAAAGEPAEAASDAAEAERLAGETENRWVQAAVAIESARVRAAATPGGGGAVQALTDARERASAFPPLVLEARLAVLEAAATPDREGLRTLREDAERAGHLRIAHRAATLLAAYSERSTSTGSTASALRAGA